MCLTPAGRHVRGAGFGTQVSPSLVVGVCFIGEGIWLTSAVVHLEIIWCSTAV